MNHLIKVDGRYGDETAEGVRNLQRELGLEADGNFGPATRLAFLRQFGFDVNALLEKNFVGMNVLVVVGEAKPKLDPESTIPVEAAVEADAQPEPEAGVSQEEESAATEAA